MEMRRVPNTDIEVSVVCLGTMLFGTPVGEEDGRYLVHWCLDNGINFIDTADIYEGYTRFLGSPGGVAETMIGESIHDRRDRVVLTTKVGNPIGDEVYKGTGLGRDHILHQIDTSLGRLRTDYVDFYELHRDDPDTPLAEPIEVMAELIQRGKVRHWGFSNFRTDQIEEMLRLCDENGWPRPVIAQPPLSWLDREAQERYMPLCRNQRVGITPYRTLGSGLLTGKYRRDRQPPEGSRFKEDPPDAGPTEQEWSRIDRFLREASSAGLAPVQYAFKWVADRPGVTSVTVGARRPDQLQPLLDLG